MRKIAGILLLCALSGSIMAYDFEAGGVYYNITDRQFRTVEVTHWEEATDEYGRPHRVIHHHHCSHHHDNEPLSAEHLRLIELDKEAERREQTAYIGKVVVPKTVRYKGIRYKVTGIGQGSFYNRRKLTEVVLPQGITYIGESAFENCLALSNVQLPKELTQIGFAAFRRCMSITSVKLPGKLQHVDHYIFAFCEHLEQVEIGASLDTFPANAFFHCIRLKDIVLQHAVPPIVMNNSGLRMDLKNMVFYVPDATLPLYKEDEYWQKQSVRSQKEKKTKQ
ncbi:MAG: leucine-rich repeat domain-containing protein [Paludibacteraceae bacterium]|nr:leucine-rich repeat domain-containing protein [Paludibacteraceae bacterium]